MTSHVVYSTRAEWVPRLAALPDKLDGKLPTLFLAHGSPMLLHTPQQAASRGGPLGEVQGPTGALATFLQDLGPALLNTYKPKAIVVFSGKS
jgi:aromatic ring-opening dioxygenase catalytic subunit (LigB family)